MTKEISARIIYLCDILPQKLKGFSEEEMSKKPAPGKWSKKELLGHLVDSAATNHQRMVRWQFEESPMMYYAQDDCVRVQHYQSERTQDIIRLWESYNRHLAHIIPHIPETALSKSVPGRDGAMISLSFIVEDYLTHMEYHLQQMVKYS